ncbi:MAG: flagellar basal body P-ring formation chaperone FlgA [Rhodospirillales bacterium]|nr:flagellar basal body P-ring formation chaperone FlgA [Rhodospirillales bacterium]
MRISSILIILAMALIPVTAVSGTKGAETEQKVPVTLNGSVVVTGNVIHLGDLFTGTGGKAATVVAYAPEPGKRAEFDVNWLYRVARTYGLNWSPLSLQDRAVVERDSQIIAHEEIIGLLLAGMTEKGIDTEGLEVLLSNPLTRIYIPGNAVGGAIVRNLAYSEQTNRFAAIVEAPAGDPSAQRLRITGRLVRVSQVPVLNRPITSGEHIRKDDIKWIKVRADTLQRNVIYEAEDLIGKTAKRGLRSGKPVRTMDVRRPFLVSKGKLVTIILETPYMTLTARGRAHENGAKGDVIRVTNTQSNLSIDAVVSGSNIVSVQSADQVVMN